MSYRISRETMDMSETNSGKQPDFFAKHCGLLEEAESANMQRGYWTPYVELPSASAYGAEAPALGEAAFRALLGRPFPLEDHPGDGTVAGTEVSPYGFELGIDAGELSNLESHSLLAEGAEAGGRDFDIIAAGR